MCLTAMRGSAALAVHCNVDNCGFQFTATDHKQQTNEKMYKFMKETYETLEMEVIVFDSEDVIDTSYWGEEDPID